MAHKVYCSFQYLPDNRRVEQIRNIGSMEGNNPVSESEWETITQTGDAAIEKWIAEQMFGRSCTIVLIGTNTAGRKWINYEIAKTWEDERGFWESIFTISKIVRVSRVPRDVIPSCMRYSTIKTKQNFPAL